MAISVLSNEIQDCINTCWECRTHCQKTLFHHCLEKGEEHVSSDHVKLMTDCLAMCQIAADFMTRESTNIGTVCAACADVCHACADSCEAIDDKEMQHCASMCRDCAEKCDDMSMSQNADGVDKSLESSITLV